MAEKKKISFVVYLLAWLLGYIILNKGCNLVGKFFSKFNAQQFTLFTIGVLVLVIILAIWVYLRQRRKEKGPFWPFWRWFKRHQKQLFNEYYGVEDMNKLEELVNLLTEKIKEYSPGVFTLLNANKQDKIEVIFTADGNRLFFADILDIVASAPEFEHWEFTAFKPPIIVHGELLIDENIAISSEDIFFKPVENPNYPLRTEFDVLLRTDRQIDLNNLDNLDSEAKKFFSGIFLVLDMVVGEYLLETVPDFYSVDLAREIPQDFQSITELGQYLEKRQSQVNDALKMMKSKVENIRDEFVEFEVNDEILKVEVNHGLFLSPDRVLFPWIFYFNFAKAQTNSPFSIKQDFDLWVISELKKNIFNTKYARFLAYIETREQISLFFASNDLFEPLRKLRNHRFLQPKGSRLEKIDISKDTYFKDLEFLKPYVYAILEKEGE